MIHSWLLEEFNDNNELESMALYHLKTGGKCLRGRLALAEANSLNIPMEKARPWALACELLHNATLIHDDIQDNDSLRRGQPSLWKKFGLAHGINVGDFLIFRAFLQVSKLESAHLTELLSSTAEQLARGQHLELVPHHKPDHIQWSDYETMAMKKTGALFLLPAQGCHIIKQSHWSKELNTAWLHLGVAYQIYDDLRDHLGLKQAGQRQKDFFEGRINALITTLYEVAPHADWIQGYWNIHELSDFQREQLLQEIDQLIRDYELVPRLMERAKAYLDFFCKYASPDTQDVIQEFIFNAVPSDEVNLYVPTQI